MRNNTSITFEQIKKLQNVLPNVYILHDALQNIQDNSERTAQYIGINRDYDWYIDQSDTGKCSDVNCGPAVAVMAAKWYDKDFARTVEDARNEIYNGGVFWFLRNIADFLESANVPSKAHYIENSEEVLNFLDMGKIVIFAPKMEYIKTGGYSYGSDGHVIIVKGYKIFEGEAYFEVYDPGSGGQYYKDGSPAGKDRLYLADEVIEGSLQNGIGYMTIDAPAN